MDESQRISYAEFGHNFIRYVVTAERLRGEIETVLKALIEGSVRKFPADLEGLPVVYAGEPLLPHASMARWIEARVRGDAAPRATSTRATAAPAPSTPAPSTPAPSTPAASLP